METRTHLNKRGKIRKARRVGKQRAHKMNYYLKALKNYATFKGRARRSEYWYFFLFNLIIGFALVFVSLLLQTPILSNIYLVATLIPGVAVAFRRMHDVEKSGWFALIPIYNLILVTREGTKGNNKYGANPKAPRPASQLLKK